jgi:hypothetical protein
MPADMKWPTSYPAEGVPDVVIKSEDSVLVMGLKIATRRADTLAHLTTGVGQIMRISSHGVNMNSVNELYPSPDDWVVTTDGSIALLSGREYRLRWINRDGTRSESPRLPFTWKHNDDDEKARLADSINAAREKSYQDRVEQQKKAVAAAEAAKQVSAGRGVPVDPNQSPPRPPTRQAKLDPSELPDYMPAYDRNGASFRADADNNVWIRPRPTASSPAGPVYDVVNRKGELIDRVQLPVGRSLIGFGPGGIVYLIARDAGTTRIEQVRFKDP